MSTSYAANPLAFERANRLYDKEKYDEAAKKYEELSRKSSEAKVHYNLGDAYYRQGKFDEARKQYEQALNSEDPHTLELSLYNLGNTHYRLNQPDQAVAAYNKALEINPQNKKTELNRDFVLRKKQQKENQKNKEDKKDQQQDEAKKGEEKGREKKQDQKEEGQDQAQKQGQEQGPESKAEEKKEGEAKDATQVYDLSRKEAEAWLQSVGDDPGKAVKGMILKDAARAKKNGEKDW